MFLNSAATILPAQNIMKQAAGIKSLQLEGPLPGVTINTSATDFAPIKGGNDIFDMRGIDRDRGCVVVVRADQYIAHVLPLDAMPTFWPSSMASCFQKLELCWRDDDGSVVRRKLLFS
jgi:hypothetical protein